MNHSYPELNPAKKMIYYTLRQNPQLEYAIPQEYMYDRNLSGYCDCPWSYSIEQRTRISNGDFPNHSARRFMQELNIGDTVIILYKGLKKSIVAEIVSDPIYLLPIVRKIKVIKELDFTLKQQLTFARLKNQEKIRMIEDAV